MNRKKEGQRKRIKARANEFLSVYFFWKEVMEYAGTERAPPEKAIKSNINTLYERRSRMIII